MQKDLDGTASQTHFLHGTEKGLRPILPWHSSHICQCQAKIMFDVINQALLLTDIDFPISHCRECPCMISAHDH